MGETIFFVRFSEIPARKFITESGIMWKCDVNIFYSEHEQAREQLFTKLQGLLELRVSKYSKTNLCDILLLGEKPHMHEKYHHKKNIYSLLCKDF